MTHQLTALILVGILLFNNLNTVVIVVNFLANQELISKTLCVQKDNQQGCNGKCHLKKQLAQNETGAENQTPLPELKRLSLDAFFISEIHVVEPQQCLCLSTKHASVYKIPFLYESFISIETPPPNFG
ncbi:hypothetical protein [Mangrovimonas futianensis]|uniref:hypothetical protein n=1 Tax=Mangrovimonas futianensis TaxID=2895523 RepID=UPI001E55FE55|nr:hypothetical protein [Mangrovimonas futianensis]MCF1195782.1 hypothetical protein [Mangrovimonas futianensis]